MSGDRDNGTIVLAITGMSCDACVAAVTRVLARQPGVAGAEVDLANGRATVTGTARPESLAAAVTAAGFGASPL